MSDTKCMLPWMSIAVKTDGTTNLCCMNEDIITRDDGTPFNVATDSLMEIYHSNWMKNKRQEFIDGKKPEGCRRCWNEEAVGRKSKRLNHYVKTPNILPLINFKTLEPKHFLYLDLKLGNICNLKCRICGPKISSSLAQEGLMQVPYAERKTHENKVYLMEGEWPRTSTKFWEDLHSLVPKIKYLDFTGGEPFMIKEHFNLLRHCVEIGASKHQEIFYNTNGTIFPKEGEELWKHFKRVEVMLSIDNLGKRYEFERSGGKWDEITENIKKFQELKAQVPQIELQVCATMSIQNVYYLEELCNWIAEQNFDYENIGLVHERKFLNISTMTPEAKELVIEKLKSGKFLPRHQIEVDRIIEFINNGKCFDGARFRTEMKELDRRRGENFAELYPEIAKAMRYDAT